MDEIYSLEHLEYLENGHHFRRQRNKPIKPFLKS